MFLGSQHQKRPHWILINLCPDISTDKLIEWFSEVLKKHNSFWLLLKILEK